MAEFFDFGSNLETLVRTWQGDLQARTPVVDHSRNGITPSPGSQFLPRDKRQRRRVPIDPALFQVREGACLVGFDREALQGVKLRVHKLMGDPFPLESFHVKKLSDILDGALLVPKIIFVAVHCPGRVLLDEEGNEGQLDHMYDEACEIGADIMVIYVGLPKSVYPHMKHMVYHPKMSEILFPTQLVLRDLAEHNSLVTVTENNEFTFMQKNVIREWLQRPVGDNHPVYQTASYMSSAELSDVEFWSESEVQRSRRKPEWDFEVEEPNFKSATEEHPLADAAAKKRKKKTKKKTSKNSNSAYRPNDSNLMVFEEEEFNPTGDIELDLYKDGHRPNGDDTGWTLSNSL